MEFKLHSEYQPTGDQPQAIEALVKGFQEGNQFQTLLGVTGSGKTFTMANVIQQLQKPTLIIAHNKTLAAQLYGEFKEFFPDNAVEYFVSQYEYGSRPLLFGVVSCYLYQMLWTKWTEWMRYEFFVFVNTDSVFLRRLQCRKEVENERFFFLERI